MQILFPASILVMGIPVISLHGIVNIFAQCILRSYKSWRFYELLNAWQRIGLSCLCLDLFIAFLHRVPAFKCYICRIFSHIWQYVKIADV